MSKHCMLGNDNKSMKDKYKWKKPFGQSGTSGMFLKACIPPSHHYSVQKIILNADNADVLYLPQIVLSPPLLPSAPISPGLQCITLKPSQ